MLECWKSESQSFEAGSIVYPTCLRPWWLSREHCGSNHHSRANAGCLASKEERWKASSNVITDGLSMPFELFTDWVNDYRQCVSWPGAWNFYPPIRYYQRALPCLAGVLPKHLTEMPTQKEECSEYALLSLFFSPSLLLPLSLSLLWPEQENWTSKHALSAEGAVSQTTQDCEKVQGQLWD